MYRILIVEDEVLIADNIGRFLSRQGHQIVGKAISYAEAKNLYDTEAPDLALLDIRLSGKRTGIDFANYIRSSSRPIPFIFLTSQSDRRSVDAVKSTFPAGYLAKPIQKETLYTTVEIAMHRHSTKRTAAPHVSLNDGQRTHRVPLSAILYAEAEHVYVRVHLTDGTSIVQRSSLSELLAELPRRSFVRTHRSFAVNVKAVDRWDVDQVYIGAKAITVSRSRRKEVMAHLS